MKTSVRKLYFIFILLLVSLSSKFVLAQTECCVCQATSNIYTYHKTEYCEPCFSKWVGEELVKAGSGRSKFLTYAAGEAGHRKAQLVNSEVDWLEHVDAGVKAVIRKQEEPKSFETSSLRRYFSGTIDWLTQSFYALKTCNNYLCCWACNPLEAEKKALTDQAAYSSCWGNPYYERCPHCLAWLERLEGCHLMQCTKCKNHFRSRQQIECPMLACNLGCYCCGSGKNCAWGKSCWAIAPCEAAMCKMAVCQKDCCVCHCGGLHKE